MSPVDSVVDAFPEGLPRASGDEPSRSLLDRGSPWVCPARAGMSPLTSREAQLGDSLPRASGDEPENQMTTMPVPRSAPRERG